MEYILLDTNIVSYLYKKDPLAEKYAPHITSRSPAISFITPAEMIYGAYKRNWKEKRIDELDSYLRSRFIVIGFNYQISYEWGKLRASLEKEGLSVGDRDLWIAATAVVAELPLVTHNAKHFNNIPELEIITENGNS